MLNFVTILILIDGFLQCTEKNSLSLDDFNVTILILIDGFLQYVISTTSYLNRESHNPYFNRWFSAIDKGHSEKEAIKIVTILILIDGFLQ